MFSHRADRTLDGSGRPARVLAPYIVTVVLLAIGGIVLISQQARITRLGHETAVTRGAVGSVQAATRRLRLRLAAMKSPQRLSALGQRLELGLVPPETAFIRQNPEDPLAP